MHSEATEHVARERSKTEREIERLRAELTKARREAGRYATQRDAAIGAYYDLSSRVREREQTS